MMNPNNNLRSSEPAGVMHSLKKLAIRHRKKLVVTFLLVAENVTFLLYPVLAGIAINAILAGETLNAALYGLMVLCMWFIGAARRSVDTRTFARIYAGLAVSVVPGTAQIPAKPFGNRRQSHALARICGFL